MKIKKCAAVLLTAAMLLGACTPHTGLEPLGKGKMISRVSLGGPIIKAFGLHIPLPYLTLGGGYGLRDDLDFSGSFHVTSTLHMVLCLDPAVTWYPVLNEGWRPTVGLQTLVLVTAGLRSGVALRDRVRLFPVLTPSAAWKLGPGRIYTGLHAMIPVTRPTYDAEAPYVLLSPFTGYKWHLGKQARLSFELKYHAPNLRSNRLAVEYNAQDNTTGINYGALAPMIGFEWSFK